MQLKTSSRTALRLQSANHCIREPLTPRIAIERSPRGGHRDPRQEERDARGVHAGETATWLNNCGQKRPHQVNELCAPNSAEPPANRKRQRANRKHGGRSVSSFLPAPLLPLAPLAAQPRPAAPGRSNGICRAESRGGGLSWVGTDAESKTSHWHTLQTVNKRNLVEHLISDKGDPTTRSITIVAFGNYKSVNPRG